MKDPVTITFEREDLEGMKRVLEAALAVPKMAPPSQQSKVDLLNAIQTKYQAEKPEAVKIARAMVQEVLGKDSVDSEDEMAQMYEHLENLDVGEQI